MMTQQRLRPEPRADDRIADDRPADALEALERVVRELEQLARTMGVGGAASPPAAAPAPASRLAWD
jgi:hypothetical protein